MEVASPLTVPHATAGSKRSLVCSPGLMDTTNRNPFATVGMDMSDDPMQRAFKRRRFQADTAMGDVEGSTDYPPFMNMALNRSKSMFPSSNNGKFHVISCTLQSCGLFDLRRLLMALLDLSLALRSSSCLLGWTAADSDRCWMSCWISSLYTPKSSSVSSFDLKQDLP